MKKRLTKQIYWANIRGQVDKGRLWRTNDYHFEDILKKSQVKSIHKCACKH